MPEIILLSGGIESSTLLYMNPTPSELYPVFIDYGQRAALQEGQAALAQCANLGIKLKKLNMSQVGHDFREDQSNKMHVPIPHRNLIALSLGLSYAAQLGANRVYIALNQEDTQAYPSASLAFLTQFQAMARTLGEIEIAAPLLNLSKASIILHGKSVGMDYTKTYSCLLGYTTHCGHCPQCKKRQVAFNEAGYPESTGFYHK
ncbi:7-cyano-7-deazaguanine synthase [Sulfurirhabdus autotrophica]|uniref:7-cyano-7-deazaguanine synthase n=1 Tax=Sulfurirhabdus autotrophica TaxID=1706046 RepID=A0A4R3Y8I3_9PROT|nr:7-cyano-7-deazaguanine synthase [Sulfurirhabdus autotrophica]TCV88160.1 7-cyano-7-deazaguanine synthase [Sulfurirhabdus autotrophica]